MDNRNCKANKYALNMQLHKNQGSLIKLVISLAEQNIKQTNVKAEN